MNYRLNVTLRDGIKQSQIDGMLMSMDFRVIVRRLLQYHWRCGKVHNRKTNAMPKKRFIHVPCEREPHIS